jgi:5-formyltetrahydrofolate cyclo-ligase
MMDAREVKAGLRNRYRELLRGLSEAERRSGSRAACVRLMESNVFASARTILLYSALGDEIDLSGCIESSLKSGKRICFPRFFQESGEYAPVEIQNFPTELAQGQFGIPEPALHCPRQSLKQLDLVLVPGVAFDLVGRRLGRGKGYYDRLLADYDGMKCGVCFDQQVATELPEEPHDIRLNYLLTPTRWCSFGHNAAVR